MNKDDIRRIARLGGVTLNENLRQKMKEAQTDELLEVTALPATDLNKLGDQVVQKAVTLAIMGVEAEAQRQAEKQGMDASALRAFVAAEVAASGSDLKKKVATAADVLNRIIKRKSVAEVAKQLKEWEKFLKTQIR
jgi:tRNA A37 threonylcarbamoyltransferase TsaD